MFAIEFRDDYGTATSRAFGRFYNVLGQHAIYLAALIIFGEVRRIFCLTGSCLCTSILCSANRQVPKVAGGLGIRLPTNRVTFRNYKGVAGVSHPMLAKTGIQLDQHRKGKRGV